MIDMLERQVPTTVDQFRPQPQAALVHLLRTIADTATVLQHRSILPHIMPLLRYARSQLLYSCLY